MQPQVERRVGSCVHRGDARRQVEDARLEVRGTRHAVLLLGTVAARAVAERPLQEILHLDLRRFLDLQVDHLVGEIVQQRQQFQELIGGLVGEPPYAVRTLLALRIRPEVVADAVAVAVAEPEAVVRLLHGGAGESGVVEVHAAVRAQAGQAAGMHRFGIVYADAYRRPRPHRHAQRCRVEGHVVLVSHGPETELVVVTLVEHAQPGERGAAQRRVGQRHGGGAAGQPLPPRHPAGGDSGHRGERQLTLLVAERTAVHQHAALGGAVQLGHEAAAGGGEGVEVLLLLLLLADPAHFAEYAQQVVAVALVVVTSNDHLVANSG